MNKITFKTDSVWHFLGMFPKIVKLRIMARTYCILDKMRFISEKNFFIGVKKVYDEAFDICDYFEIQPKESFIELYKEIEEHLYENT